ncbi:hypothetical protein ABIE89_005975 [Bradyrhizobium niftali]
MKHMITPPLHRNMFKQRGCSVRYYGSNQR